MDDEEIRALLAAIDAPTDIPMPIPPNMSAIPAPAVVEAGGDPLEVEAWVTARRGWAKRVPPQFLAPDAAVGEALLFLVPDRELVAGQAPATGGAQGPGLEPRPVGLGGADLIAFAPTVDLKRARTFYEKVLGLKLEGESPIACAFRVSGTLLRVVAVERYTAPPFTILGWSVADIGAAAAALAARGVVFERFDGVQQDEHGVWRSPGGAQVAWFKDPDGSTLSLTQF